VSNASGLSRGDRNRNRRVSRLRSLVPVTNAIVAIDLADGKQMLVVCDHDSRVLARRTLRCRPWQLGDALDWAAQRARAAGFAGVTVACEPTGHRWQVVGQLAGERGMPFVCVQTLLVAWARRNEDLTNDKTDDRDAMLIGRLVGELRCYEPEPAQETWTRLRHLGARRERLVAEATAGLQQMRDLLECAWPAVLQAAAQPFNSATWCAALDVVLSRAGGNLARARRLGPARFEAAVRRRLPAWGKRRPSLRIARAVFAALTDGTGVAAVRPGILERVHLVLADWHATAARLADTESRMVAVLDELELTDLVCSIRGLSAVGAAAILAETGDPARFATPRSLVKHAGLAPRERASGTYTGRTRLGRAGRPRLRLAAWRAAWVITRHNPVLAARFRHLTTRQDNRLNTGQARAAVAAALLRQLHVVVTRRQAWDPVLAGGAAGQLKPAA
jgi:transposase